MEQTKNENALGLKIGFWNINELSEDKSSNSVFKKKTQLFDITF